MIFENIVICVVVIYMVVIMYAVINLQKQFYDYKNSNKPWDLHKRLEIYEQIEKLDNDFKNEIFYLLQIMQELEKKFEFKLREIQKPPVLSDKFTYEEAREAARNAMNVPRET